MLIILGDLHSFDLKKRMKNIFCILLINLIVNLIKI